MSTVTYDRTGELPRAPVKAVWVSFDQYEVLIAVSETDKILGIQEIRVRKDFRAPSQIGSMNFDEYYKEE